MSITFNKAQLEAIESRDTNIMVSASAGAGKTTLLIERLRRRILEDRVSLSEIVAMTFTEKAAGDMKRKLSIALDALSKQYPDDPFVKQQLALLPTAQISTIHSFCLSILKEFGYLIGLNPHSLTNILGDEELLLLSNQALTKTKQHLDNTYKTQVDYLNTLNFFSYRIEDKEKFLEAIKGIAETLSVALDPTQKMKDIQTLYQAKEVKDYPKSVQSLIKTYTSYYLELLENDVRNMDDLFLEAEKQHPEFKEWLLKQQDYLSEAKSDSFSNIKKWLIKCAQEERKDRRNVEYTKYRTNIYLKDHLTKALEFFLAPEDLSSMYPQVNILLQGATYYLDFFKQAKEKAQGIDFNDIEKYAYQILTHEDSVARDTLKARYKEIMVDEFQDSNEYQNEIAKAISNGKNIFRVGDVKQSIYGFRHAKPELMMSIKEQEDDVNKTIFLSNNYRSKQNIVSFANLLFENLLKLDPTLDQFSNEDWVSTGREAQLIDNKPVQICLLDPKQVVSYTPPFFKEPRLVKPANQLRVAYYIAQDIKRKHDVENIPYKDMTVLVRTHGRKKSLKRAFEELNIPYYIEDQEGYYHAYSVLDVLHFIRLLLDNTDELALLWVLQSGFVNYSEDELAQLKLVNPKKSLWKNLESYNSELVKQIKQLSIDLKTDSPAVLLTKIYHFNQYYLHQIPLAQKTNCDLLFEKMMTYFSKPNTGYKGFLEQSDFSKDVKSSNAASISEVDDVVKVHTVHQSKGLEYPITYFYGFKKDNKDQDTNSRFMMDADFGLALPLVDFEAQTKMPSLFWQALKHHKLKLGSLEEIRNLYVTLTRAENELIIVDIDPNIKEDDATSFDDLIKGENYIKLILKGLNDIKSETFTIDHVLIEPIVASGKKQVHEKIELTTSLITTKDEIEPMLEEPLTLNLSAQYGTQYGTSLHELLENPADDIPEPLIEPINRFNNHPLTQSLNTYPNEKEVAIAYKNEEAIEYGYMDWLIEKEDEVIMVDYKTNTIDNPKQLLALYQGQMDGYYEGLKRLFPNKKILQYLYSFYLHEYIEVVRD